MKAQDTFLPWLKAAKRDDQFVYYTGITASQAPRVSVLGALGEYKVSALAWAASEAGFVRLYQRRNAAYQFDYIAVRTAKRYDKPLALLVEDPEPAIR